MSVILKGLYREPVLFSGLVSTILAGLSAAGVIAVWIGPLAVAVGAVITRRYTRPDRATGKAN